MTSEQQTQNLDDQIAVLEKSVAKLRRLKQLHQEQTQLECELSISPATAPVSPSGAQETGPNQESREEGEASAEKRFVLEADGIYRHKNSRTLYHRPSINGRRTWRSLETENLRTAKEKFHNYHANGGADEASRSAAQAVACGIILERYKADGCPDNYSKARLAESNEFKRVDMLMGFWDKIPVSDVDVPTCIDYFDWRVKQLVKVTDGRRTTDQDFSTFRNALRYGQKRKLFKTMPLAGERWPRFKNSKDVRHCRECMPANADELHVVAEYLFSSWKSCVLGWQALFEANTGLRTSEMLELKVNASPDEPGFLSEDKGWLRVRRGKGQDGIAPHVKINAELTQLLAAHKEWHSQRHSQSPWFFPSPVDSSNPVGATALVSALDKLRKEKRKGRGQNGDVIPPRITKKITSHGLRAFYVTVRRSHGINDAQIGWEIGHTSRGKTIIEVYGGAPEDWSKGGGPKMSWLPKGKPAWSVL